MRFEIYVLYGFLVYNTIQYGRLIDLQVKKKSVAKLVIYGMESLARVS